MSKLYFWLLLLLVGGFLPAQQEIVINDEIPLKKGKITQDSTILRENGCIDIFLNYIGDCANRFEIYQQSGEKEEFLDSHDVPNGTSPDIPYKFSFLGLKGNENFVVYVGFIDCIDPEPLPPPPPPVVYIPTNNPCDPCPGDCDTNGVYAFNYIEHNGWLKQTSIPMNTNMTGIGLRTDFASDSLFILNLEISPLTYNWVRYFLDYYEHYTTADIMLKSQFGLSSIRLFGMYQLSYHYENSDIDKHTIAGGLGIYFWKIVAKAEYITSHLYPSYPFRPTDGFYHRIKANIGLEIIQTQEHRLEVGSVVNISKYTDDWYEVVHQPLLPGVYAEYYFCRYPFSILGYISWQRGNQEELYKIENLYIDPPIDIFEISINGRYFF